MGDAAEGKEGIAANHQKCASFSRRMTLATEVYLASHGGLRMLQQGQQRCKVGATRIIEENPQPSICMY